MKSFRASNIISVILYQIQQSSVMKMKVILFLGTTPDGNEEYFVARYIEKILSQRGLAVKIYGKNCIK